jgi:hypothetical protein
LCVGRHQFNCDSVDIVVIVSVTRNDLRDEFAMANEAFALSPISARAAQPSEADYEAIREAFLETSRGRWFLGEYAKRNRNADTTMVLDAVARIEETLAAQDTPARDPRFDEALAALRAALSEARAAASTALSDLALEKNLAPVRKGARVIREISWRLREIGADGRICDLIDSQVGAIEGASAKIAETDPARSLDGAFDLIEGQLASFEARDEETDKDIMASDDAVAKETFASPVQVADDEGGEASPRMTVPGAGGAAKAAISDPAAALETVAATFDADDEILEPADAFDAGDEAVLDMVAAEMAAPDSDETYVPSEFRTYQNETYGSEVFEGEAAEPAKPIVTERPEPRAALAVQRTVEVSTSPLAQPSLGSSLLANGIVQRPRISKPDPLAPIRRMSQTEKIAFFS